MDFAQMAVQYSAGDNLSLDLIKAGYNVAQILSIEEKEYTNRVALAARLKFPNGEVKTFALSKTRIKQLLEGLKQQGVTDAELSDINFALFGNATVRLSISPTVANGKETSIINRVEVIRHNAQAQAQPTVNATVMQQPTVPPQTSPPAPAVASPGTPQSPPATPTSPKPPSTPTPPETSPTEATAGVDYFSLAQQLGSYIESINWQHLDAPGLQSGKDIFLLSKGLNDPEIMGQNVPPRWLDLEQFKIAIQGSTQLVTKGYLMRLLTEVE